MCRSSRNTPISTWEPRVWSWKRQGLGEGAEHAIRPRCSLAPASEAHAALSAFSLLLDLWTKGDCRLLSQSVHRFCRPLKLLLCPYPALLLQQVFDSHIRSSHTKGTLTQSVTGLWLHFTVKCVCCIQLLWLFQEPSAFLCRAGLLSVVYLLVTHQYHTHYPWAGHFLTSQICLKTTHGFLELSFRSANLFFLKTISGSLTPKQQKSEKRTVNSN